MPPDYSSKFADKQRLSTALEKTGPNSPNWSPPNTTTNGATYQPPIYADPNGVPFGYGIPANGTIADKVQMTKVKAIYNYQTATGKWELSTMHRVK